MGPQGSHLIAHSIQQPATRDFAPVSSVVSGCRKQDAGNGQPASSTPLSVCSKAKPNAARQISKELSQNWPAIKEEMEYLGRYLTKWNLVKAITLLSDARKVRFLRSKKPRYGTMNKGFVDEELERFFAAIDDQRFYLLFSYQAMLGLRIGEAVRININDLNLKNREIRIFTEKSGKTDYLIVPQKLFESTISYIGQHEAEIASSSGFLFFPVACGRNDRTTEPHVTSETARKFFRVYVEKAKLQEIYAYTKGARPVPLYRLTPHSLRHYAITNFCRKNGGNMMLASKFARHNNVQITMTYVHVQKNELYESIERAQNKDLLEKVRKMQDNI